MFFYSGLDGQLKDCQVNTRITTTCKCGTSKCAKHSVCLHNQYENRWRNKTQTRHGSVNKIRTKYDSGNTTQTRHGYVGGGRKMTVRRELLNKCYKGCGGEALEPYSIFVKDW